MFPESHHTYRSHGRINVALVSIFKCSRAVGLQAQADQAQADIGVVLRNDIPTADLPTNEFVAQTLVDAANSSETFSVSLKASSIQVICK